MFFLDEALSVDSIAYTVLQYKESWKPADIGGLFFDRKDYLGLLFWYDKAKQYFEKIKNK